MLNNNDWLAKQIGLDAVNKFIDENNKEMPGDDYTVIETGDKESCAFLKPDGTIAFNTWFEKAYDFSNGNALVYFKDGKSPNHYDTYGYIDIDGKLHKDDDYYSDRKAVYEGNEYYFIDRDGNQISGRYSINKNISLDYKDGFAIAQKLRGLYDFAIIDKNGNEIPQEKDDEVVSNGNIGYGYYLTGDIGKMRGIKLKDAYNGITIDKFQEASTLGDLSPLGPVKEFMFKFSKKELPDTDGYWDVYKEVTKESGVLFFGEYWFLGPTNLKTTKEGNRYCSRCEFGEFVTKYPPLKAIDDNYVLCAHNNAVYVYDKKTNTYTKSCTRKEVEDMIRRRNAKQMYHKMLVKLNAYKAYKKLHPNADIKIKVSMNDIVCGPPAKEGKNEFYYLQPVILDFPALLDCFSISDFYTFKGNVMYGEKITGRGYALDDLKKKAKEGDLDKFMNREEDTEKSL